MIQLFTKKRGSITVFLSLILVPTLLFMSIMVDGAALALSKGVVESAGELASNAALADYDTVLKDVYGLFAMSQKADDPQAALAENVSRYFEDSMKANGIIPEQVTWDSDTMNWISAWLNGSDIDDATLNSLLNISMSDTSQIIYMQDSSLADPTMLRSQIVEYAKYRAPVNAAMSALDSLGAFKKVAGQSEVLDTKTEVDDKLKDINSKMKVLYNNIVDFDAQVSSLEQAILNAKNADFGFDDVENALLICHAIIVNLEIEPLASYDGGGAYSSSYDDVIYCKSDGTICKVQDGVEVAASVESYGSGLSLSNIETAFNSAKTSAESVKGNLATYNGRVVGYATFSGMDTDNWNNTSTTSNPTLLKNAMDIYKGMGNHIKTMYSCILAVDSAVAPSYTYPEFTSDLNPSDYLTVEAYEQAVEAELEEKKAAYDAQKAEEFENEKSTMKSSLISSFSGYASTSEQYKNAMISYQNAYATYNTSLRNYLGKIHDLLYPVAREAAKIANNTDISWNWFDTHIGTLAENTIDSAEDVKSEIIALKNKITEYEGAISDYETGYAEGNADTFSAMMDANAKKMSEQFNATDLDTIIAQINSVVKYVKNNVGDTPVGVIAAIDSFKLCDQGIVGYWAGDTFTDSAMRGFVTVLTNKYKNNSTVTTQWATAKTGTYAGFDVATQSVANQNDFADSVLHNVCTDTSNPYNKYNTHANCYLKKIGEVGAETADHYTPAMPPFYVYLVTNFEYTAPTTSDSITKDTVNDYREDAQEEAENANEEDPENLSYESSVFDEVPSGVNEGDSYGSSDSNDLFGFFRNAVTTFQDMFSAISNLNGENVVETMLLSEYIMNDFSLYTDMADDAEEKKTYSNVAVNAQNNKLYGCEVEYILYGRKGQAAPGFWIFTFGEDKGPEINVNEAKAQIFSVRLMFNMVYAMTDSTIDYETLPPAMAIQAASAGVFPYQVAQTVIKLSLALSESNYDVTQIMDNKKMPLMKTKDTWKYQLSGVTALAKDFANETIVNSVNTALAKVEKGVVSGLQNALDAGGESLTDVVNNIGAEMDGLIDAAIDQNLGVVAQCYTSEIESYYQSMLTEGNEYNREVLLNNCESAVNEYLASTNVNPEMQMIISDNLMVQLETVLASGGTVDVKLQAINDNIRNANFDAEQFANDYKEILNGVSLTAQNAVSKAKENAETTIMTMKNDAKVAVQTKVNEVFESDLKPAVEDATKKVSETINQKLDEFFPSSSVTTNAEIGNTKTSAALGAGFKMGYEDYIRVFLIVKLLSDRSEQVITRIADVIQVNINEGLGEYGIEHPKKGDFRMASAYTFMEIDAHMQVEPILISQDWFENWLGEKIEYLEYDYHSIAGY